MTIKHGAYSIDYDGIQYILRHTRLANKVDKKTRKPTGEKYETIDDLAYCTTIDRAVQRLVEYELKERHEKEVISLQDFLREYRNLVSEISCYIYNKEEE